MKDFAAFLHKYLQARWARHRLVVWYDPEGVYVALVEEVTQGAHLLRFEGSYLGLRFAAEGYLEPFRSPDRVAELEDIPPAVLYVPRERDAKGALIEVEHLGIVLQPGGQPDPRSDLSTDTALATLAREALAERLPPAELERVVAQVAEGKLTVADLDKFLRPPEVPEALALALTGKPSGVSPAEVVLAFLSQPERDVELRRRGVEHELRDFLARHLEVFAEPQEDLAHWRTRTAHLVLCTEALVASGQEAGEAWQALPQARSTLARGLAAEVAQTWRRRRDLASAYRQAALEAEEALSRTLASALQGLPTEALVAVETFRQVDDILLEQAAADLSRGDAEGRARWRGWIEARRRGFWASLDEEPYQALWQALAEAVACLDEAERVARALRKGRRWTLAALMAAYADAHEGWYRLDQAHRRFEQARGALLDRGPNEAFAGLENAVRRAYWNQVAALTERMARVWEQAGLPTSGERPALQREIFRDLVAPALQDRRRVAYVWVDALRYELAAELADRLTQEQMGEVRLTPRLSVLPGITLLGMAALLPGAEGALGLTVTGKGALAAEVEGRPLLTRDDRLTYLQEALTRPNLLRPDQQFTVLKLEDLDTASPQRLEELKNAHFLLITSQEIDELAENAGPAQALEQFQSVLRLLWRMLRWLQEAAFDVVVITADHGFLLLGDGLAEGLRVEPPAGTVYKIGRRYWIGKRAEPGSGYVALPATQLEMTGDLTLAFPRGGGVFPAQGGHRHYFHGGLAPQEHVIPVLRIDLKPRGETLAPELTWTLDTPPAVTTRTLRVTITAQARQMFPLSPRRLRLEVNSQGRALEGVRLTAGPEAAYDEDLGWLELAPQAGQLQLGPATVVLYFTTETPQGSLTLTLRDVDRGVVLAERTLPVNIMF